MAKVNPDGTEEKVSSKQRELVAQLDADNKPNIRFPKQHTWKNAFHTFEHAIVGYLTGQEIHDLPSKLYFAFKSGIPTPEITQIRPYLYAAKVKSIISPKIESIPGYGKQIIIFTDVR